MHTSKKLLIAGFTIATVTSAGLFAHSAVALGGNALDGLANTIATQYHLNQDQVKVTLEQFREQKIAEREAAFMTQLDQAVQNGTLSPAQKTLILNERTYLKTQFTIIQTLQDPTARKDALRKLHADIKQWANDNNIPIRWLRASSYATVKSPN